MANISKMISISEAFNQIETEIQRLGIERISINNAVGRILAQHIYSDMDMPPFDRSQMDGFAIISADTKSVPVDLRIIGESVAGRGFDVEVRGGEAVRIMTGARVPPGADAVQKKELSNDSSENRERVTIFETAKIGQNIVSKGAEIKMGEVIFSQGERITSKMIASLAAFGFSELDVFKRPRVAIIATGSEIVPIANVPAADQIRNSNSQMLASLMEGLADIEMLPIISDDQSQLETVISEALERCDCLLVSGGVSVGDYDFTKPALRAIGAKIIFERIALKPGKPTVFARIDDKYIFGLPGNPVSIAVTYYVFVRNLLLRIQGAAKAELNTAFAKVSHPIKAAPERDSLLPVSLKIGKKGRLSVETLRFSGSSNFIAFSRADALVSVPRDKDLRKGDTAQIYFLPEMLN